MTWRIAAKWLCAYLIATGSYSMVFAVLVSVYTVFPSDTLGNLLSAFSMGVPLFLIGIGVISLLPFSEYTYVRQAGINPPIAREIMQHRKRRHEKRELGILLGIVGLTLLLRIDPWQIIFFLSMSISDAPIITVFMVIAFALLILVYQKLRQQIFSMERQEFL